MDVACSLQTALQLNEHRAELTRTEISMNTWKQHPKKHIFITAQLGWSLLLSTNTKAAGKVESAEEKGRAGVC